MSHKMHTGRLQDQRDTVEKVEFRRPEEEIIARYEKLYTGAVNDVMREMCLIIFRGLATGAGEAFYYPSANSLIGQLHQRTRALAMRIH